MWFDGCEPQHVARRRFEKGVVEVDVTSDEEVEVNVEVLVEVEVDVVVEVEVDEGT